MRGKRKKSYNPTLQFIRILLAKHKFKTVLVYFEIAPMHRLYHNA